MPDDLNARAAEIVAKAVPLVIPPPICPISAAELLRMDIPLRDTLMDPFLPQQGGVLMFAPRGIGKTFMALSLAYAVASGGTVMRWRAKAARRVLYVDGEMPLASLQERLAGIAAGADHSPPDEDNFRLLPQDHYRDGLPDIASPEGRALIERHAEGTDLVVLDNLSSLIRARENEADDWQPMQDLVLSLRRKGTSALLIHHAGKGGDQRGTSRREDIMDTVISLKRPDNYGAGRGAQFEVHFTKARGFTGADAAPFMATLHKAADGALTWEASAPNADNRTTAHGMFTGGAKVPEVMKALGLSKATAYRWHAEWKSGGGNG